MIGFISRMKKRWEVRREFLEEKRKNVMAVGSARLRCEFSKGRSHLDGYHQPEDGEFVKMMGRGAALFRCKRCKPGYFEIYVHPGWRPED